MSRKNFLFWDYSKPSISSKYFSVTNANCKVEFLKRNWAKIFSIRIHALKYNTHLNIIRTRIKKTHNYNMYFEVNNKNMHSNTIWNWIQYALKYNWQSNTIRTQIQYALKYNTHINTIRISKLTIKLTKISLLILK